MSTQTAIEWTDVTDNIIVAKGGGWWCRKVSPACAHCYAEALNQNTFFGGNKLPYSGDPPELVLRRDVLDGWKRQTKAKKHFVASMTDIFGEWVEPRWQFEMFNAMAAAPLQTFQLLTKRADVMAWRALGFAYLNEPRLALPKNVWLGFTAENQRCFDDRWREIEYLIQHLMETPTIFVSAEPLLGRIVLPESFLKLGAHAQVITGGESGSHARPSNPQWFYSLRDQCVAAGVKFFFKQWGEWAPWEYESWDPTKLKATFFHHEEMARAEIVFRAGKKTTGRLLEGREWSQFPVVEN